MKTKPITKIAIPFFLGLLLVESGAFYSARAQSYPDISGNYFATETYVLTGTAQGHTVTVTNTGVNPSLHITQTGNTFTYTVTDPNSGVSLTATGTLNGNSIVSLHGPAIGFKDLPGLVVNNNQITSASGTVSEGQIDIHGTGSANVTYQGIPIAYSVKFTLSLVGNVTPLQPPQIIAQPQSAINAVGTTATFSIVATGADVSAYRWRKNSVSLVNSAHIKGANSDTLIITNVTAADAGNYTCVVPNSIGSVTSVVAQLVVLLPPTNSITMPTPNLHWSNSDFTVTGKANGSVAVQNVFYNLNDTGWVLADTTDGWNNWMAQVTLTPGTNRLSAYAEDVNGFISATSRVIFVYVVSDYLTVSTNGSGSIAPNYNHALLQINADYSMTAAAKPGFAFANWSDGDGNILTNKPTLKFRMASGLALIANFVDTNKPALSITNLVAGRSVSNELFTVKGKASDNVGVANVFYRLTNNVTDTGWQPASSGNNFTNWSADLDLSPGTNSIAAYAVDAAGNVTTTSPLKFFYVVSAPLTVSTNGKGSISPALNNVLLQIGKNYTLTATPAKGFKFTGWTGADNSPVTNKPTLIFQMGYNLSFTANFIDTNLPTVTVTTPTAATIATNEFYATTGKATDNVAVDSVWYQLNGGDWMMPTTTNSWTNWNATLDLTAGTNILSVYAVDTAGNISKTNRVTFNYKKMFTLTDYYPLPLGAQWLYTNNAGFNAPGPAGTTFMSWQVADINYTITNYTGVKPVHSYVTNSVNIAKAYLGASMEVLESWNDYMYAGPAIGYYGDDDFTGPDPESFRAGGNNMVFPAQMAVGGSATISGPAYSFGTNVGTASVTLKLLENTSLTVQAGTFSDVLHFRMTFATGKTNVREVWWAKSVGQIKHKGISNDTSDWELIQYSIPSLSASAAGRAVSRLTTMPAIRIGSSGFDASRFGFDFTGQPGQTVVVEGSTDLQHWQPLQTNILSTALNHFSDLQWTNYPCRFYRVKSQ